MRYASTEEKELWQSGAQKYLTLEFEDGRTLTNNDIYSESMEFEQSISEENELRYGQCSASCFKIRVFATSQRYAKQKFTAKIRVGDYTRNIGTFIVDSDKATADKIYRDLVCYDELKAVLETDYSKWHNGLTFPMTLKQYRDAFFSYIGITQETTTLPNDSMKIEKNFVAENYSGIVLLQSICEINGTFGYLNYDNQFRYVVFEHDTNALYPSHTLYPSENLYPRDWVNRRLGGSSTSEGSYLQGSLTYEEYDVQPITQVQLRQTETDIGAIVGPAGNTYIIQDNPLLYGKTTAQLTEVGNKFLSVVRNVTYTPCTVECTAGLWMELGDSVGIMTRTDDVICFILHRTISGITRLMDKYEAKGQEFYTDKANSTHRSLLVLQQKTNELFRDVEETRSTITNVRTDLNGEIETRQTQIQQTAEAITAEASRASAAEGSLSSKITQTAEAITAEVSRATTAEGNLSSRITQTASDITTEVKRASNAENGLSSSISQVKQTAESITLKVSNGGAASNTSTIKLMRGTTEVTSQEIKFAGMVLFSALKANARGTTIINGNNISTGIIHDAEDNTKFNLSTGELTIKKGSITLGDLFKVTKEGALTAAGADITGVFKAIQRSSNSGKWYKTQIQSNRIIFYLGGTGTTPKWSTEVGAIDFVDEQIIDVPTGTYRGNFTFDYSTVEALGGKFGNVVTKEINGEPYDASDKRLKKDIRYLQDDECFKNVVGLKPVRFKYRANYTKDTKTHHGFIAQDVEECGFDWDFVYEGQDGYKNVGYKDLIADLVGAVKHLSALNDSLKKRIGKLEETCRKYIAG